MNNLFSIKFQSDMKSLYEVIVGYVALSFCFFLFSDFLSFSSLFSFFKFKINSNLNEMD